MPPSFQLLLCCSLAQIPWLCVLLQGSCAVVNHLLLCSVHWRRLFPLRLQVREQSRAPPRDFEENWFWGTSAPSFFRPNCWILTGLDEENIQDHHLPLISRWLTSWVCYHFRSSFMRFSDNTNSSWSRRLSHVLGFLVSEMLQSTWLKRPPPLSPATTGDQASLVILNITRLNLTKG